MILNFNFISKLPSANRFAAMAIALNVINIGIFIIYLISSRYFVKYHTQGPFHFISISYDFRYLYWLFIVLGFLSVAAFIKSILLKEKYRILIFCLMIVNLFAFLVLYDRTYF